MKLIKWVAGFFDETKPQQSFSRAVSLMLAVAVVTWDSAFLRYEHKLVDAVTMAGQVAFMTAFYVARRIAGAYTDTKLGANQPETTGNGAGQGTGQ
jgi:hypothetical protein